MYLIVVNQYLNIMKNPHQIDKNIIIISNYYYLKKRLTKLNAKAYQLVGVTLNRHVV